MNRPRRPFPRSRRRKPAARRAPGEGFGRRRSPLDLVPPGFRVLGTGVDRQALLSYAQPQEMFFVHAATKEIEDKWRAFKGRAEDFWEQHEELMDQARQIDEVLHQIVERKREGE